MKLFNTSDEFAIIIGLIPFLHDSSHTKLKIQIDRYTDLEFSEYLHGDLQNTWCVYYSLLLRKTER